MNVIVRKYSSVGKTEEMVNDIYVRTDLLDASREAAILWCRDQQRWAMSHLHPEIISVGHGGWVKRKCPRRLAILGMSDGLMEEVLLLTGEAPC
jgi:hypothetical protein